MYLEDKKLFFVQIPNIYEKPVVEFLRGGYENESEQDFILDSLHPERTCERIGFLASRRIKLFSVVQNTYERLIYLYLLEYQEKEDIMFHNFGEYVRYVFEQKVDNTVDQMWYLHDIPNGDIDNIKFRLLEHGERAVDDVFVEGKGLDKFISDFVVGDLVLEENKVEVKEYYTPEIRCMVDIMYQKEIEYFEFKFND